MTFHKPTDKASCVTVSRGLELNPHLCELVQDTECGGGGAGPTTHLDRGLSHACRHTRMCTRMHMAHMPMYLCPHTHDTRAYMPLVHRQVQMQPGHTRLDAEGMGATRQCWVHVESGHWPVCEPVLPAPTQGHAAITTGSAALPARGRYLCPPRVGAEYGTEPPLP